MTWKWFISRSVRQAHHSARHVQKLVHQQRDLLTPQAIDAVQADVAGVDRACDTGDQTAIREAIARLEKTANKWLKPFPHAAWRENVEVLLVAIAVAMAIRTFFLQPFKIPTGSMQPTLFGVTYEDLHQQPDVKIPTGLDAYLRYWFNGESYIRLVAKEGGAVRYEQPKKFVLFNLYQRYWINGNEQPKIWFPPDQLFERAGFFSSERTAFTGERSREVNVGEEFIKMRVIAGDHLFVDRLTYNFRKPARGDIIVFETHGISTLARDQQDTYYIKRLIGLGGEHLRIGDDRHVIVDGKRLDAATPHFEFVYSFDPKKAPHDSEFSGHVNDFVGQKAREYMQLQQQSVREGTPMPTNNFAAFVSQDPRNWTPFGGLAPHFLTQTNEFVVPQDHFLAMGDNTMNSSDGRAWGPFPQEKVIGKSFFVYWPIGSAEYRGKERASRFGWAHR